MINLEDLREIHPVYCYPKGDTVSFDAIQELIEKTAREFNVPIAFAIDEVVSGKLPNLIAEDCLVLYHPEHKHDYFKIVFRIRREGKTAYIIKNDYGISPQMNHAYTLRDNPPDGVSIDTINMGKGNAEFEAEKNYYLALQAIFEYIKC